MIFSLEKLLIFLSKILAAETIVQDIVGKTYCVNKNFPLSGSPAMVKPLKSIISDCHDLWVIMLHCGVLVIRLPW